MVMALFSSISVFCSGWRKVFVTMAFATSWMGMDMDVEHTAETAPKNFLVSHSAGRLSWRSTNKTLLTGTHTHFRLFILIFLIGLQTVHSPQIYKNMFCIFYIKFSIWPQSFQWDIVNAYDTDVICTSVS